MAQIRVNDEYYETHGLVTSDGELVTTANPLPVTQTDMDVTLIASNSGTASSCEYSILLIANE